MESCIRYEFVFAYVVFWLLFPSSVAILKHHLNSWNSFLMYNCNSTLINHSLSHNQLTNTTVYELCEFFSKHSQLRVLRFSKLQIFTNNDINSCTAQFLFFFLGGRGQLFTIWPAIYFVRFSNLFFFLSFPSSNLRHLFRELYPGWTTTNSEMIAELLYSSC